ncbi:MAG: lysophospholipid acyltransferase family protein [Planctomycetales bacterium]|nr:lysophospholipid acyltransferase family protein [Planctomycetales bacterium]
MKIRNKFLLKTAGFLGASVVRNWMGTLDYQAAFYDRSTDPIHQDFRGPVIFVQWHEYLQFTFYLRGNCNTSMLISQHQDGELLGYAARHMGFSTVRGSSTRGGVAALRKIFRAGGAKNLAITPDGPKGPRRKFAQGAIYLSSRLGIPLIAIGMGYDRAWRVNTWDRFAIPKPYARARVVTGPRIQIPPDIDRDGIEHYRQQMERFLNMLTEEAEAWASSGGRFAHQVPLYRAGAPIQSRRAA